LASKAEAYHLVSMGGALLFTTTTHHDTWHPPPQLRPPEKFPRLNLDIPTHGEVDPEEEFVTGWELPDAGKNLP
ncbi:hypothetical protein KI387_030852, partial [Taxus chinensis]